MCLAGRLYDSHLHTWASVDSTHSFFTGSRAQEIEMALCVCLIDFFSLKRLQSKQQKRLLQTGGHISADSIISSNVYTHTQSDDPM